MSTRLPCYPERFGSALCNDLNGAKFLGEEARIGSLAVGKQADIMIVRGNPATKIQDIRNVQLVFKDGVGYDSAKLIDSIRGLVGVK